MCGRERSVACTESKVHLHHTLSAIGGVCPGAGVRVGVSHSLGTVVRCTVYAEQLPVYTACYRWYARRHIHLCLMQCSTCHMTCVTHDGAARCTYHAMISIVTIRVGYTYATPTAHAVRCIVDVLYMCGTRRATTFPTSSTPITPFPPTAHPVSIHCTRTIHVFTV